MIPEEDIKMLSCRHRGFPRLAAFLHSIGNDVNLAVLLAGDAGLIRLKYNLVTLVDDELIGGSIAIILIDFCC